MISCSVLLRMKNVSDKSWKENQNTRLTITNFFPENHAIREIMWQNMVESDRPQIATQHGVIPISCWITTATRAHNI